MLDIVLTETQTKEMEAHANSKGIGPRFLIEAAGASVARIIQQDYFIRPILIMCGPGHNGADGLIAAYYLKQAGWPVKVALYGKKQKLKPHTFWAAQIYNGPLIELSEELCTVCDPSWLVVDALFGIGLNRPIEKSLGQIFEILKEKKCPVISIDLPTGLQTDTGNVMGATITATQTIALTCYKPAHCLMPGKMFCGKIKIVNLGIPTIFYLPFLTLTKINYAKSWIKYFPLPLPTDHKYNRGHVLIVAGDTKPGAAVLSSVATRRVGAGLVTVLCRSELKQLFWIQNPGLLVIDKKDQDSLKELLEKKSLNVCLIGPGAGWSDTTKDQVLYLLQYKKYNILDADALNVFSDTPDLLWKNISSPTVITPHEGEFIRLFPTLQGNKIERAQAAAKISQTIVVFKGHDTVIAHPEGYVRININAPSWLATAGSGDVLAGLIAGLMAQGMPPFESAAAAVWLQGKIAQEQGIGFIAEDVNHILPKILARLISKYSLG
ncbi:MAG: NAD(P)H-hydrate dehydratase [Alphaproteobacteria bacterium]|nr:NAD(P)H-hydrate dehydratase [Alphaproteobacteria bacterium]